MEYFVISAKFVPLKYYTLSSQLQRLTSFSVGGVRVGEFCHPARKCVALHCYIKGESKKKKEQYI